MLAGDIVALDEPAGARRCGEWIGICWAWRFSGDRAKERQFAEGEVGWRADAVAVLGEHLEVALVRVVEPALDPVEVAKQHVDGCLVDGEPGSGVHDRAPVAELGDVAAVAQAAQVVGVERLRSAVVEPEVPVAWVVASRARARAGAGNRRGRLRRAGS
jgi:hypothetical protein